MDKKKNPTMSFDIEQIKDVIADRIKCNRTEITDETDLVNDLGADSIDMIDLLMALENKFGCSIPIEDVVALSSPKDIYKYLSEM